MTERIIVIDEIDPVELYGINNRIIDLFSSHFPKIRITVRGSEILLKGNQSDIDIFEEKFSQLTELKRTKRHLSEQDVEFLLSSKKDNQPVKPDGNVIVYGNEGKIITARTKNQKRLVECYEDNDLLFAVGPAGTGKSYTAIALAVRALKNREVRRIILTRPAVEAGERLGFLPGDLREKLDPYLQPLYDALRDMLPSKKLEALMEEGIIQIAPLAYMRGRTLESAVVILDEAQNTTLGQLKMFLTRMGHHAKFIVTGDVTQVDLPHPSDSGLIKGMEICRGIKGVSVISFGKEDIVRHPIVTKVVSAFEKMEKKNLKEQPH